MNEEKFDTVLITISFFQIVRPVSALLVIDVQNDFISGSLAITGCPAGQDGAEVKKIKQFKCKYTLILRTK